MSYLTDRLRFYLADEGGFIGGLIGAGIGALGGLLGGGGGQQTTQQNTLPKWAQDYLRQSAQSAGAAGAAIGQGGPLVGGVDPLQQQGAAAAQGALGQAGDIFGFGQQLAQAGLPGATASIADSRGQFANPYLDQQLGFAEQDFQRALEQSRMFNQQGATAAGALGGQRHGVADALGSAEALRGYMRDITGMRQQDFAQQNQFAFQNQAQQAALAQMGGGFMGQGFGGALQGAGMLGSFGSQFRDIGNQQLQDPLQRAMYEQQLRAMGSSQFGALAGSKTNTGGGNIFSRMLGGAATGAGIAGMFGGGGGDEQDSNWFNFSDIGG